MGLYSNIVNKMMSRGIIRQMSGNQLPQIMNEIKKLTNCQMSNYLWDKTLHCKESGKTDMRICDEEVVVSLTSYGERIHNVHLAIESIMQQTVKPNRIVLWLAEDEFKGKTLPVALQMQQKRGLEIAYCEDLKSYKKIIPALKRFPEACIITIDDDLAYNPDMIEKLINAHKDRPSDICAVRMHGIVLDEERMPRPYDDWHYCVRKCPEKNNLAFFTTGGGVLFPPHCFLDEVYNKDVFMNICNTADDVWFNAMRLLNDIHVTKVFSPDSEGDFYQLSSSDINPLNASNWQEGGNDNAIKAVYGRYGLFEKLSV